MTWSHPVLPISLAVLFFLCLLCRRLSPGSREHRRVIAIERRIRDRILDAMQEVCDGIGDGLQVKRKGHSGFHVMVPAQKRSYWPRYELVAAISVDLDFFQSIEVVVVGAKVESFSRSDERKAREFLRNELWDSYAKGYRRIRKTA